jgi:hypothetical protein
VVARNHDAAMNVLSPAGLPGEVGPLVLSTVGKQTSAVVGEFAFGCPRGVSKLGRTDPNRNRRLASQREPSGSVELSSAFAFREPAVGFFTAA